jgi:hypothetical protein
MENGDLFPLWVLVIHRMEISHILYNTPCEGKAFEIRTLEGKSDFGFALSC